jgi:hypothetical protein
MDELWVVPHGMAGLYLDHSGAFHVKRTEDCVAKLLFRDVQPVFNSCSATHIPSCRSAMAYFPNTAHILLPLSTATTLIILLTK